VVIHATPKLILLLVFTLFSNYFQNGLEIGIEKNFQPNSHKVTSSFEDKIFYQAVNSLVVFYPPETLHSVKNRIKVCSQPFLELFLFIKNSLLIIVL